MGAQGPLHIQQRRFRPGQSWFEGAVGSQFPLQNLPYGVFASASGGK
jgi:hypothetical protein